MVTLSFRGLIDKRNRPIVW